MGRVSFVSSSVDLYSIFVVLALYSLLYCTKSDIGSVTMYGQYK